MNNQNYNRRINERVRRRRRRAAVLTVFFIVIILLALLSVLLVLRFTGHLVIGPDNPAVTTEAPAETKAPVEGIDPPVGGEITAAPETTAPPVTYKTLTLTRADMAKGDLILVSADHPYVFPATEGHLTLTYGNKSKGYQLGSAQDKLDTRVLAAFNTAADAFLAETGETGLILVQNGAYRSYETQKSIYDKRVAKDGEEKAAQYVALPGNSEHHTGLAMDLSVYADGKMYGLDELETYKWVPQNFPRYGFVLRYPASKVAITGIAYEPWHLRYVGIPHAVYMTNNNLCLEEYINALRAYQADGTHLFVESDGITYEIWYVPLTDGEVTYALVPENVPYTISGNNRDGFVVTLTLGRQ